MANRSRRRSARRLRLAMFLSSGLLLTGGILAAYITDVFGDLELDEQWPFKRSRRARDRLRR